MSSSKANSVVSVTSIFAGIFLVVACMVPLGVIAIIGLATGTVPLQAQGSFLGHADGYPAFNPQSWLLYIPALAALFLAVWTIPLPMRAFPGTTRRTLSWECFLLFCTSLPIAGAFYGAPGIANEGAGALLIMLLACLIVFIRQVLGWVRLVPKSWREDPPKRRRTPKK